ncbi:GNAT family N-acetyltransferase [Paenibacillus glycanilyticus]|uniref:GNAT family N-acetyltransferase n=1 Tax=Paenibacillus glycanilyticus TaxID=126569 RepID=UPI000FD73497|nr:GNAT family N-acetyltransferase [Paenibacillus glycanilyticus]
MEQQQQTQLLMLREDLGMLPDLVLPKGYVEHSLRSGDEYGWERIIMASFGGEHHFDKEMASDDSYKPERVRFISIENGEPVATASAWYRPQCKENTGYLHMVGLLPEHAGKKLGYAVSLAALHHMAREGRTRAVLHTDDFRIPAIKTYFDLGFIPELADDSHLGRWVALAKQLNRVILAVQEGTRMEIKP